MPTLTLYTQKIKVYLKEIFFFLVQAIVEEGFGQISIKCLGCRSMLTWVKMEELNQLNYTQLAFEKYSYCRYGIF